MAENTPLGHDLRALGVRHKIIGTEVPQAYAYRLQLLLVGYPRLAWSALRTALRSMLPRAGRPDAVVISSDVEALVFALVRLLPVAAKPRLVFMPFIYTQRASPTVNRLRLLYYRFVMRQVSCAICHSVLEIGRYQALFAGCGTEFVFVPWGGYVPSASEVLAGSKPSLANGAARIVAAGRSGRDYPTLVQAARGLPFRVTIICNARTSLDGVVASDTVDILPACFGMDYLGHLLRADVVVVPLRVDDISAGQMVLIQAMALGRPLIVTRTPTVGDYLRDGDTALLVPRGDADALASALRQLLDNPDEARRMGARAQADYLARFSNRAHLRDLVHAVEQHCGLLQDA